MDEVARSVIDVLKDTVTVLSDNFCDVPGSAEVTEVGKNLSRRLEGISEKIGKQDIRFSDGQVPLHEELEAFFTQAVKFDTENCDDMNKTCLKHLNVHIKSLDRVLSQDWNNSLPKEESAAGTFGGDDQEQSQGDGSDPKTPEKTPRVFEKFTPLNQSREKIDCCFCGQSFGIRTYQNHLRDKHKDEDSAALKGEKEKLSVPVGTCKMNDKKDPSLRCNRKFPLHHIKRHLRDYHGYNCPGQDEPLRGFESKDGGKVWEPIFLKKSAPDPDYDVLIQVVKSPGADEDDGEVVAEIEDVNVEVVPALEPEPVKKKLFSSDSESSEDEDKKNVPMIERSIAADMSLEDEMNQNADDEGNKFSVGSNSDATREQDFVPDVVCGDYEDLSSVDLNASPRSVGEKEKNTAAVKTKIVFIDEAESSINDTSYHNDSDYEEGDSVEFTKDRLTKKAGRHSRRDEVLATELLDLEGNKTFYSGFQEFMKKRHIAPKEKDNTLDKAVGHLFKYDDSLLSYETQKNEDFCLDRLISFKSEEFLKLKFPLDWLQETCEGHPSKAQERLKAHSYVVKFIQSSVDKFDFGGSTDDQLKRTLIIDGLDRITKEVSEQNLHARYQNLIDIETAEKKQARMIANPSEAFNVAQSVLKWNRSKEAKAKEQEFLKIYEDCMKNETIKSRPFTTFSHYVRFKECITDKNRSGAYELLNSDIALLKPQYWPEGYSGYGELPDGWDPNVAPSPETEPSAWTIQIAGSRAQKCGRTVLVTFLPGVKEWIERLRDVKELLFTAEQLSGDKPFFVNYNNQPLSNSGETAIWKLFHEVTGVSKANITQIRKGAEMAIRTDSKMTSDVQVLNNHSDSVGAAVYNIGDYQTRAEYVNAIAVAEGSNSQAPETDVVNKDRRRKRREEDEKLAREKAEEILSRDKKRRKVTLSAKNRVKPTAREFMQNLVTNNKSLEIHQATRKKFPVDKKWKTLFYRLVDSSVLAPTESEMIISTEEEMFRNVKPEVEKELGIQWDGGVEANRLADLKIAQCFKNSFKYYESTRQPNEPTFFKFT